jgi:hypothetical protein
MIFGIPISSTVASTVSEFPTTAAVLRCWNLPCRQVLYLYFIRSWSHQLHKSYDHQTKYILPNDFSVNVRNTLQPDRVTGTICQGDVEGSNSIQSHTKKEQISTKKDNFEDLLILNSVWKETSPPW